MFTSQRKRLRTSYTRRKDIHLFRYSWRKSRFLRKNLLQFEANTRAHSQQELSGNMANNMSNVNRGTTRMFFCSRHWGSESYLLHFYTSTAFFCVILTITATLGNSLILLALQKDKSLHPPSKLLLRCLTVTDLSVGVIGQPAAITLLLSAINENWKLCRVPKYLAYVTNDDMFWRIFGDTDRFRCGQTARSVVGVTI